MVYTNKCGMIEKFKTKRDVLFVYSTGAFEIQLMDHGLYK
jgi:hypothetical protein